MIGLVFLMLSAPGSSTGEARQRSTGASVVTVLPGTMKGAVKLQVHVGTDGRTTNCSVLQSSGSPEDDRRACTYFLKFARPNVRRDMQGNPIEFEDTFWVDPPALKQLRDAGI